MVRPARRLVAALVAVLAGTSGAAAAAAGPAGAASPEPAAAPPGAQQVTLLTGDVVTLAPAGSGRYAATVQPAPGRESVTFHTVEVDGGLLVLPSDAVPYLSAGVLDRRLFDVPGLVAQGYADAEAPQLPLIVRYDHHPGALATTVDGPVRTLDSIGAAVVAPDRADLPEVWSALSGPRALGSGGGVAEVWLDGKVTPALDRSVPQIGALAAWDAGYDGTGVDIAVLDTGVDGDHPDLAGRVAAVQDFTGSPDPGDRFGHGTHVASIAAGTGAAGRSGVAPGARVLSGKVLNDSGFGLESWIIAGMEWAVEAGAEVVNLSLGGGTTDGTDPLSRAVDTLSDQALFVVSAGNEGGDYTVTSPGSASTALTVGAVDRDESLASFSSRGPRVRDNAVKPEITAPGVAIVAARAAGTALGTPVDADYTAASGTSMAAPHVAGAAALLAQAYPEWQPARLKDALVSTAVPNPELAVFAQGGGRVDAAAAVTGAVHATGVLDFGLHRPGKGPLEPVPARISYTNRGGTAVTLDLAAELSNLDQPGDASGALTLDRAQVTVPAGGTVEVGVELELAALERGRHTGRITATGPAGAVARTTLAATLAGPVRSVTFRALAADGSPTGADFLALHGTDPRNDQLTWVGTGQERTVQVEEGTYLLHALIPDFNPQFEQATLVTDPELAVTGDLTVVLDAGTATPVRIETPRPSEQRSVFSHYVHRELANGRRISHGAMHFSAVQQLNVTPTEPVTTGAYEFSSRWQLVEPMVRAAVPGLAGPLDVNLLHRSPTFEGRKQFRLVWAGTGTPEELAAAGVRGAAALVEADPDVWEGAQVAAAAEAGAAAVLIVREAINPAWTVWRPVGEREPLPAMVVGHDDGQRIIDRVRGRGGESTLGLELTVDSPYLYDVMHVETGRVPDRIVHRVTGNNTARFPVGYTETGGFGWLKEQRFGWRPWQTFAWNDTQRFLRAGSVRDEWVSAGDTLWQHRVQHEYAPAWDDMNALFGGMTELPRSYPAGRRAPVSWFAPVVRPGAATGIPGAVSTRTGDRLALRVPELAGQAGQYGFADSFVDQTSARLLAGGELVAELPDAWRDVPAVPEPADYRLELTVQRESEEWQWSTRTETAWQFRSAHTADPEPLRLLQVDYQVPADLTGRVSGWFPHLLRLSLRDPDGPTAARTFALEVSYDEGGSWRRVPAWHTGHRLLALVPPADGTVSLRVHAEDRHGAAVTQTVIRAYGLR